MTVDDLPTAFASLPAAWRDALPGWTAALQDDVVERVRKASDDRPIAPADPFRALRFQPPQGIDQVACHGLCAENADDAAHGSASD